MPITYGSVCSGIEEAGEAITLMIHHLHGLGPTRIRDFRKRIAEIEARLRPRSPLHHSRRI